MNNIQQKFVCCPFTDCKTLSPSILYLDIALIVSLLGILHIQEKYGIEPTMVVQGVKMLYVPVMPGHAKRLKLT